MPLRSRHAASIMAMSGMSDGDGGSRGTANVAVRAPGTVPMTASQ
jgi:hypothetical protein